jgi:hypothetical protein
MILDIHLKNVSKDFLDGSFINHICTLTQRVEGNDIYLRVVKYNSDVPDALFFLVEAGLCDGIEILPGRMTKGDLKTLMEVQ